MPGFAANFLRDGKRLLPFRPKPAVYFGVFGKHPGWDDHMDGIGLETDSLVAAREVLYIEGIGRQVNSGEWEKLAPEQRLDGFEHLLLWKRKETFLLGKMWSSRDGKGRDRYPMIACAQFQGIPLESALAEAPRIIEGFEDRCKATKSAEEVGEGVTAARDELRGIYASGGEIAAPGAGADAGFIQSIAPQGDDDVFYRVLYYISSQFPRGSLSDPGQWESRAARIRLPAAPQLPGESLIYWSEFLERQTGGRLPVLIALPLSGNWIDAWIGTPAPADFYPLRASPAAVAIVSEIGYEIDPAFRQENQAAVLAMREGTG